METVSSLDLINYLTGLLRYLTKNDLVEFAQLLLEENVIYLLHEMSTAELNSLIVKRLVQVDKSTLIECAQKYIPQNVNFQKCAWCGKIMDCCRERLCGHTVHSYCFIKGKCPICLEEILKLVPPNFKSPKAKL